MLHPCRRPISHTVIVLQVFYGYHHPANAAAAGRALLQSREVDFVPCSGPFLETFETFAAPGAAGLSFADGAVVTIARRNTPAYVATFDRVIATAAGVEAVPSLSDGGACRVSPGQTYGA